MRSLVDALTQRDGITGAVDVKEAMFCPYTCARLTVFQRRDKTYTVKGGFNPYMPFAGGVEQFEKFARARNGHGLETAATEPEVSVEEVAPPLEEDGLKEKYAETAAGMTEGIVGKAVSVPVHGRKPKGPARKKDS